MKVTITLTDDQITYLKSVAALKKLTSPGETLGEVLSQMMNGFPLPEPTYNPWELDRTARPLLMLKKETNSFPTPERKASKPPKKVEAFDVVDDNNEDVFEL